jgi:hypothetical protein
MYMVAAVLAIGCGDRSPVEPTPPGRGICGLGPIALPTNRSPNEPPCDPIFPGCPRAKPADARTLIVLSSCPIGANQTSCPPVQEPFCPRSEYGLHARVVNPNRPTVCTGDVFMRINATPEGGARIQWYAQEKTDAPGGGCQNVGQEFEGEVVVEGPCCERILDIRFPNGNFTSRWIFRTDWQP